MSLDSGILAKLRNDVCDTLSKNSATGSIQKKRGTS
jgi:hypothetical protein